MTSRLTIAAVCLAGCLPGGRASAQALEPGPPGPFVVDVRGVTSGVPTGESFFPTLPAGAVVPSRGFGGSVGVHVYALRIGPARLGIGADALFARGSTVDASSTLTTVAPQLSLNFGTSDGWSYLSTGVGATRIDVEPGSSATVRTVNIGGGARWFLGPHLGVGFDVRFHRMAAGGEPGSETPASMAVALGVGVSVK